MDGEEGEERRGRETSVKRSLSVRMRGGGGLFGAGALLSFPPNQGYVGRIGDRTDYMAICLGISCRAYEAGGHLRDIPTCPRTYRKHA